MPAMPEPRPKVSASIHGVRMPMALAMARFWVTARICRPKGVRLRTKQERGEDDQREDDDPQAVLGDRQVAELERARHPGRVADLAVVRPEIGAHRLLQDQRDAPGGEQRLERPAVEEADDAALDDDADAARDEEGERQRDRQRPVEEPAARCCG